MSDIKIFTDGGARSNPGPAGYGYVIYDLSSGSEIILRKCGNYIGTATNNQAEYEGLINALDWVLSNINRPINAEIFLDSMLVVKQSLGEFKVKNSALKPLNFKARALLSKLDSFTLNHVMRDKNAVADELYNNAIDEALS